MSEDREKILAAGNQAGLRAARAITARCLAAVDAEPDCPEPLPEWLESDINSAVDRLDIVYSVIAYVKGNIKSRIMGDE